LRYYLVEKVVTPTEQSLDFKHIFLSDRKAQPNSSLQFLFTCAIPFLPPQAPRGNPFKTKKMVWEPLSALVECEAKLHTSADFRKFWVTKVFLEQ